MHPFKKKSICLLITAIVAASAVTTMAAQPDQTGQIAQIPLDVAAPPTKISPQERAKGNNIKLDDALLRLKLQQTKSTPVTNDSHSSTNETQLAQTTQPDTYVTVEIVVKGDPVAVKAQLEKLGFKTSAVFHNHIGGRLPISQIDSASKLTDVRKINKAEARTNTGSVNSQGDLALHSKLVRDTYMVPPQRTGPDPQGREVPLDGSGLTIGVISDSFNCFKNKKAAQKTDPEGDVNITQETDVKSGDLPAGVNIVKEGDCTDASYHDEGRAMAQIIHDVAPGAKIAFYSPDSPADMALGIMTLAMPTNQTDANGRHGAGAKIIVDDLGWFVESPYDAGIVGQGIDEAANQYGIAYFSSAGNAGQLAYDNSNANFAAAAVTRAPNATSNPLNLGERLLNFDTSGRTTIYNLPVSFSAPSAGYLNNVEYSVYWDQPTQRDDGSAHALHVCLADRNGNPIGKNAGFIKVNVQGRQYKVGGDDVCADVSTVGQEAQISVRSGDKLLYGGRADTYTFRVGLVANDNANNPAPTRVHIFAGNSNFTISPPFGSSTGTILGHPLSPNASAVGAADYFKTPYCDATLSAATLQTFSSSGGTPLLFNADGTLIVHPAIPQKPDFVAPDGASTTFFGGSSRDPGAATTNTLNCRSTPWQFYGTSAAAPHAAAVAALLWQKQSNSWPVTKASDISGALKSSAVDMGAAGFDYSSGNGFIQTDSALPALQKAIDTKRKNGQW